MLIWKQVHTCPHQLLSYVIYDEMIEYIVNIDIFIIMSFKVVDSTYKIKSHGGHIIGKNNWS
jgi:hypothetical protein